MRGARYIFRLDDITPTMDWDRFWATLSLLQRHRVKPLLGIVPDNRDPKLNRHAANSRFWEIMRSLKEDGIADVAQHGCQHLLSPKPGAALLRRSHGSTTDRSEFAGFTYHEQVARLARGRDIMRKHGIETPFFFAPNHAFDRLTLRALRGTGFTAVSDGVSLYPYRSAGLTFVPQQMWNPQKMATGVFTICLHTNDIRPKDAGVIRRFLRMPVTCSSFSAELERFQDSAISRAINPLFWGAYSGLRSVTRAVSWWRADTAKTSLKDKAPTLSNHLPTSSGEAASY